jgi:DNA-binding response OmpR family regulator
MAFKPLVEILKTQAGIAPRQRARVLHVDDDYDMLTAVAAQLRSLVEVISVDSTEKARRILTSERIDLVVLEIGLGQDSGMDLLPDLRDSSGKLIPVIIFSNRGRDDRWEGQDSSQVDLTLSKMNSSLESLANAVRDRLSLPVARPAKETT